MHKKLTSVMIYHGSDLEYILLQAKTFSKFADINMFEKIIIIENFSPNDIENTRRRICAAYGSLKEIVEFYPAKEICDLKNIDGWLSQQILKLQIAKLVKTERYIVFDAKKLLIKKLEFRHLENKDGAPLISLETYKKDHPLFMYLKNAIAYFNLPPSEQYIERFTQTITPFTFFTAQVNGLIEEVERRENKRFAAVFQEKDFTEFFLYSAYIISKSGSIERLYAINNNLYKCIWAHMNDQNNVEQIIAQIKTSGSPIFSIHRRALIGMSKDTQKYIATFLHEKNVFEEIDDATIFFKKRAKEQNREHIIKTSKTFISKVIIRTMKILKIYPSQ